MGGDHNAEWPREAKNTNDLRGDQFQRTPCWGSITNAVDKALEVGRRLVKDEKEEEQEDGNVGELLSIQLLKVGAFTEIKLARLGERKGD